MRVNSIAGMAKLISSRPPALQDANQPAAAVHDRAAAVARVRVAVDLNDAVSPPSSSRRLEIMPRLIVMAGLLPLVMDSALPEREANDVDGRGFRKWRPIGRVDRFGKSETPRTPLNRRIARS